MNLYQQWKDLMDSQTQETIQEFWNEYSGAETKIYSYILEHSTENLSGTVKELSEQFEVKDVIFMGFLDGINTSLNNSLDLDNLTLEDKISLDIDFEKLFLNMLIAEADYLATLTMWDEVLPLERRKEIYKDYKRSKIVKVGPKTGRNEPCPCGSGKKYKKCCGK